MRLKLTIEYAGTRYSGWQIQKNAQTVQGEIERAIHGGDRDRDFELYGSGRTDAGVHALAQVAHLDIDVARRRPSRSGGRSTTHFPSDIAILSIEKVRRVSRAARCGRPAVTCTTSHAAGRRSPSRLSGG